MRLPNFFSNNRVNPKEAALTIAGGVILAYMLFHAPVTLLVGLLIAACLYIFNNHQRTSALERALFAPM